MRAKELSFVAGLAALVMAGPAFGAAYMKYESVPGDSATADNHRGWLELGSVQFATPPGCTPSGPGAARIQGANNMRALGTAAHVVATLDIADAAGGASYLRVVMRDILITSVTAGAAPGTAEIKFSSAQRVGAGCPAR